MNENGFKMAYIDTASEVTLLLIHGFPLNSTMWWPQINGLDHVARVVTPDLRGYGQSETIDGECTIGIYSADCAALLDSLKIDGKVVVCGLSMGGYIAFDFCRRYPERVSGLILTATRAAGDSEEARAGRDESAAVVRRKGVSALTLGLLPKLFAESTYYENDALVNAVEQMMGSASRVGVIGSLLAMRDRTDSRAYLGKIDVPTLVLHGEEDLIVPVSEAKIMAQSIPNATFVSIPNAGHLPNLEQVDVWNKSAEKFLKTFL